MEWLNYHHLLYFWTVVKAGSVVKAAEELRLSQPTVSSQVRALEAMLGERLFTRAGRRLVQTDTGQMVFRYADEIFSLGRVRQFQCTRINLRQCPYLLGELSGNPKALITPIRN